MLTGLISPLNESEDFKSILKGFQKGYQNQLIYGLSGSISSYFMAGFSFKRPSMLVLTANFQQARKKWEDLKTFLPGREVLLYPEAESTFLEVLAKSKEILAQRLNVLNKLMFNEGVVVVAPVDAILKRLTPIQLFKEAYIKMKIGDNFVFEKLISKLSNQGYERVNMVEAPGHFSLRGGILDVFPLISEKPYRIEFFDDQVDSIRQFEIETQRSIFNCPEILIPPARELILQPDTMAAAIERLKKEFIIQEKRLAKQGVKEALNKLRQIVKYSIEQLEQGIYFETIEQYLPFFYQEETLLFNYLPPGSLVVFDEPIRLKEVIASRIKDQLEEQVSLLSKGYILPTQGKVYIEKNTALINQINPLTTVSFSLLPRGSTLFKPENIVNVNAKNIHGFIGRVEILAEEIKSWRKNKYAIVILVASEERAYKIKDILANFKIDSFFITSINKEICSGNVVISIGGLEAGFEYNLPKLVFITDKDIFGLKKKSSKLIKGTHEGVKITNIEELAIGDFIVHENHGIGKYLGIKKLDIGGYKKDYLLIKYAGEDKLYVPTDQVGLIQKYLGSEGKAPKLNKLGGNEWAKVKNRVKESVQVMAKELLELYAVRESRSGYPFSIDTVWQKDFEDSFPYEETDDQLRTIDEIKKDMESDKPMDRLLCGDVGYGKTEVAIRAAFKAVMDGKQVAVLVPTTILAQQHFNTFSQRFAGYPVVIDVLSRFRTAKQQKETIEKLKQGQIEIIIGTHRLVQKDIAFKDMGLTIVDEEQRFGVSHKEKLKTLKKNVDVLTLTATPIPRTLHMSMIGLRDISILENPPEDRFPVQTYVLESNQDIIRDAVQREIDRGGQVYFVHNRISDIEKVANELQKIVPEARIALGHGQMREEQLEKTIIDFISGQYDVLVCTTIIETGLDIPNVNTIVVNEADRFGLSQLYQLRGRVGRSHRLAYAYFTYKKEKVLSEVAEKRLHAIREFTEFGSGFKIALRDLEIRGVGNILGPEQHGHMMAVGFDLYCRLLEGAIQELKGEEVREISDTTVEINVDGYISNDYISDSSNKIEFYKKIMMINNNDEAMDVADELIDRYGDIPQTVNNLLAIARIKACARLIKVESIKQKQNILVYRFWPGHNLTGEVLLELSTFYKDRIVFISNEYFEIKYKLDNLSQQELLETTEKFVNKIESLI